MNILVTGGAGYIGSHTSVELLSAGHDVVVLDNLDNSSKEAIGRLEQIAGRSVKFHEADLLDAAALERIFQEDKFDAVIHFAGLKSVGESCEKPLLYWRNNVGGTLNLVEAMKRHDVKDIIFSSSATVYGDPESLPISEEAPLRALNPYGRTKLAQEELFRDICAADKDWTAVLLRYFNPVGAHPSGLLGENPRGLPNNLMPFVALVAIGKLKEIGVFGDDYPTPDGTGRRDYIHVLDLAKGHLSALAKIKTGRGAVAYNLGTGRAYSVLEMIRAFEAASGCRLPYSVKPRRAGDSATVFADPGKAARELGWRAELTLEDMCRDAWRWTCGSMDHSRQI
jgi:UDP-glucose 4-epimerase